MLFACWIIRLKKKQPEYVTLVALPQQKWLLEGASVLRYIYTYIYIYTHTHTCLSYILPTSTNIGMCRVIWIKITNIKFHSKKCDGVWCCPVKTDGDVHDETSIFFLMFLLTVHLSIFISVINQLDAQKYLFYNKFISCLYMFRAHVLIIGQNCITQPLVSSHWNKWVV